MEEHENIGTPRLSYIWDCLLRTATMGNDTIALWLANNSISAKEFASFEYFVGRVIEDADREIFGAD